LRNGFVSELKEFAEVAAGHESGAEATALQTLARLTDIYELRGAFGLRRVHRRFLQVSKRRDSDYSAFNLSLLTSSPTIFLWGFTRPFVKL
jgi:hypothetical protein